MLAFTTLAVNQILKLVTATQLNYTPTDFIYFLRMRVAKKSYQNPKQMSSSETPKAFFFFENADKYLE